jgi:hypothetical protein
MNYYKNIIFIILVLFITLFIIVVLVINRSYRNMTFKTWKVYHRSLHQQFLSLFHKTAQELDRHNIIWWVHAGTLLGTIRHEGFIPWDDDVDLVIYCPDKNDFLAFSETIMDIFETTLDLTIQQIFFGFKIRDKFNTLKNAELALDLFVYFQDGDRLMGTDDAQNMWPNEWYYIDQVFPLTIGTFDGLDIPVPRNPWAFLERVYSSRFYKEYRVKTPHGINFLTKAALYLGNFNQRSIKLPKQNQKLALSWKYVN